MAKYTVELRTIVDSGCNIFNFDYTFYDESKKTEFQNEFIEHFAFYEIGQETTGRFIHYLKRVFHEKLPYYNMLYRTALIDYEKTKNYNMVETFERAQFNNATTSGLTSSNGSTYEDGSTHNTLNRDSELENNGTKNSILESNTDHDEDTHFHKAESSTDKSTNTKESIKDSDLRKVDSNLPQTLVSMTNIKGNILASNAEINDNNEETNDTEKLDNAKTNTNTEDTGIISSDNVNGSTHDTDNNTSNENTTESNNGTSSNNTDFSSASNTSQDLNGSENENTTRTFSGSYGVITEADMLKKHIDLQLTLTTIMNKFFEDECESLFMMIF